MNRVLPPPTVAMALLLASAPVSFAQTMDWGQWDSTGTGLYTNGDAITIRSLVNGSVTAVNNETATPHIITDPAFPLANSPGTGEFGYFHNEVATNTDWSILIDLSGFTMNAGTVIGFSNLDGRSAINQTRSYGVISFRDSSGNPVDVSGASFLGAFDYSWQGITWDATSTFDPLTGVWSVIKDSGSTHPAGSYFGSVGNAFFLTNLPSSVAGIVYTNVGSTNYLYDSTLFYAGNVIPEPSSALLSSIACTAFLLRRRRA